MTAVLALIAGSLIVAKGTTFVASDAPLNGFCKSEQIENTTMDHPLPNPTTEPILRNPPGMPAFNTSINRHGLREQPFNATPPNDTLRVLVVGDSFTWGPGLSQPERYTEKLEKLLDPRLAKNVQVINAGLRGRGMRDFYQYLYNHGFALHPDFIVISFLGTDDLSARRRSRMGERIRRRYDINNSSTISQHQRARNALVKMKRRFHRSRNWSNSDILTYGNLILELARRRDTNLLFYYLRPVSAPGVRSHHIVTPIAINGTRYNTILTAWSRLCNIPLISAPPPLSNRDRYTFPGDPHYNARAHTLLAKTLSFRLAVLIREQVGPDR